MKPSNTIVIPYIFIYLYLKSIINKNNEIYVLFYIKEIHNINLILILCSFSYITVLLHRCDDKLANY